MEFLRVFDPYVYSTIRDNRDMFVGASENHRRGGANDPALAFHETWLSKVAEPRREQVKDLVTRLFPKAGSIWGGMGYGSEWNAIWRKDCRVCSKDMFDVFFQFGVSNDVLSRAELDGLLAAAADLAAVIEIFKAAKGVIRPDGRPEPARARASPTR